MDFNIPWIPSHYRESEASCLKKNQVGLKVESFEILGCAPPVVPAFQASILIIADLPLRRFALLSYPLTSTLLLLLSRICR